MSSWKQSVQKPSKEFFAQGLRFVLIGVLNTLGTVALYQLLLFILPYTPAYALSWFAGLIFVNFAYPRFVYGKSRVTRRETALNSVYYASSFAASWSLLYLFTTKMSIHPRLSVFCVLVVMVPLNFLATRYIYRPGSARSRAA